MSRYLACLVMLIGTLPLAAADRVEIRIHGVLRVKAPEESPSPITVVADDQEFLLDFMDPQQRAAAPQSDGKRVVVEGLLIGGKTVRVRELLLVPAPVLGRGAALPGYAPRARVGGAFRIAGSDSMEGLLQLWDNAFTRFHPDVKTDLSSGGSGTAVPALLDGKADVGALSRPLTKAEAEALQKKFGAEPLVITVCEDAVAVVVHPENPIKRLTLEQVRQLFCKGDAPATWGQVGLKGEWEKQAVNAHVRDEKSGTHVFFRDRILTDRPVAEGLRQHEDNARLLEAVGSARGGVAIVSAAEVGPSVKAVPLVAGKDGPALSVDDAHHDARYPLIRPLFLVLPCREKGPESAAIEFARFALSAEGQAELIKDGFLPLPGRQARLQLNVLDPDRIR